MEKEINSLIKSCKERAILNSGLISDGSHSFEELYYHRNLLFILLAVIAQNEETVWRSKSDSDGNLLEGWFILGIGENKREQLTYHFPMSMWYQTDFATELPKSIWKGGSSQDSIKILKKLIKNAS